MQRHQHQHQQWSLEVDRFGTPHTFIDHYSKETTSYDIDYSWMKNGNEKKNKKRGKFKGWVDKSSVF